jgi:inner membrane protein
MRAHVFARTAFYVSIGGGPSKLLAKMAAKRAKPRPGRDANAHACAAPDLDFVIGFLGPVAYLQFHRGVTHSLLMLPLWALVLACRRRARD